MALTEIADKEDVTQCATLGMERRDNIFETCFRK